MAAVSRFSKAAKFILSFSQLALIVSLLDLLPFPLSLISIRFAPCILFFPGFWTYPEERKGAQSWCLYIDSAHTVPIYILILDDFLGTSFGYNVFILFSIFPTSPYLY
jgi:hypothetical protein